MERGGWTTKAPTEPGFYWLKLHYPISGDRSGLTVVSLQEDAYGELVVCFHTDDHTPHPFELRNVGWWPEPLRSPE